MSSNSTPENLFLDVVEDVKPPVGWALPFESDGNPSRSQIHGTAVAEKTAVTRLVTASGHGDVEAHRSWDDQNVIQEGRAEPAVPHVTPSDDAGSSEINRLNSDSFANHAPSPFCPNVWHSGSDKTALLDILRKRKVLIESEIQPELMAEISQVSHVYVLQSSEDARLEDPDEWQHALGVFLSLVDQPMLCNNDRIDQWMFIFVDPSLGPHPREPDMEWTQLQHYQYGELVCENMLGVTKVGIPTAKSLDSPQPSEKAKKRGSALLPCPLADKKGCGAKGETHRWKCDKCSQELEYGFDGHFYCDCGKAPADSFVFHCGKPRHGREHVGFPDIDAVLQQIKPFKEINILVLGETGVGKPTWINGFGNFLTYPTLDDALQEPVYLIPAQFTTMDSNFKETVVSMGSSDNEATQTGESATQMPKTYTFKTGNVLVRLIDTPGIGDTRGTEQDKKNFVHIMQHLAGYETLHGICILLKPNSARLTVMFQFCVKELLTHLHRDACHNITFIFTNARATFYRPGDTFPTLKELIKNSKGVDIPLSRDTVYCVDSEAVRFMAALKSGVEFDQTERENFVKSWEKSVEETKRLLQYISTRTPHVLQNTLSLNEARRMILSFTEPLTHITKNIQTNLMLTDDKAEEIRTTRCNQEQLKRRMYVPMLGLDPVQLDHPRTVCTSQKCIKLVGQKVNYVTWCHERCYLNGVIPNQYPQPGLKRCEAMVPSGGQTCFRCQCAWEMHMHITYELREIQSDQVDQSIVDLMRHKDGEIAAVEQFMEELQQRKLYLLEEEEQIRRVSAKFGYFLKKNAMLPYNDSVEGYLYHLISAEEEKVAVGASRDSLRNYERMLGAYREEKRILEEAMQNVDDDHQITAKDITQAMQSLFDLPINGQTIRNMVDVVQNANGQQMRHSEIFYAPKQYRRTFRYCNPVQSVLDTLDNSNCGRPSQTSRDFSERSRNDWTLDYGNTRDVDQSQQFGYNRGMKRAFGYGDQQGMLRMPEYGNRPRLEGTSGYGGAGGYGRAYGNYGHMERTPDSRLMERMPDSRMMERMPDRRMMGRMSDSRMTRPHDRGFMGGAPFAGGIQQLSAAGPSSQPDIHERVGMLERVYQGFQQWMK